MARIQDYDQYAVLKFIVQYKIAHDGNSPSLDEISDGLGWNSKSTVHRMLSLLESEGLIMRGDGARSIEVSGGRYYVIAEDIKKWLKMM